MTSIIHTFKIRLHFQGFQGHMNPISSKDKVFLLLFWLILMLVLNHVKSFCGPVPLVEIRWEPPSYRKGMRRPKAAKTTPVTFHLLCMEKSALDIQLNNHVVFRGKEYEMRMSKDKTFFKFLFSYPYNIVYF